MLAIALVLAATALLAAPAGAVIVHLRSGKDVSYLPLRQARAALRFDALFSNLDYNGGPVMPSNANYAVYWAPGGEAAYPERYIEGIDRYFKDLAHDSGGHENVDSVAAQYDDAEGQFASYDSRFAGLILDKDPYPANGCTHALTCLTDAQIQAELKHVAEVAKTPTDLTHEYFLLTPEGVESCFEESVEPQCSAGSDAPAYCAYHSNVDTPTGELIYANDPYVTGIEGCDEVLDHPNESPADGALQGGLSHEHNESTTDPLPNSAWTDFGSAEPGEIGDKCASQFGAPLGTAPDGSPYNQLVNGDEYFYQEEWSNETHQCLQRLTPSAEAPSARFGAMPAGGDQVTFDASASTAPGGVSSYELQFNEPPPSEGEPRPVEQPTPLFTHTFTPGEHRVALTVFSADGASRGGACTIEVPLLDETPSAAFTVAGAPNAGAPLSFDASGSSDPDGAIGAYAWSFGDGATATGASATHAYAATGSYEVTLSVVDSSCMGARVAQTVVVTLPPPVPAPPPTPAAILVSPAPTGTVALATATLKVKRRTGTASVKLSCAGTASACQGQLVLVRTVRSHGRTHTVTLATVRFSIRAGTTAAVVLRLNQAARNALRAARGHQDATLRIVRVSPAPTVTRLARVRLATVR